MGTAFGWKLIFPIYAVISLVATICLWPAPIKSEPVANAEKVSFGRNFSLLKDSYILLPFIAIVVLVGVDVGMNVTFPKVLMDRCDFNVANAGLGNSAYFLARTVGAFCGGFILMKINEKKFYLVSVLVAILGLVGILCTSNPTLMIVAVAVFGLGYSNLYGVIFSLALKHAPERSNEVASLLVTGLAGGALITPILGIVTDIFNSQASAVVAILLVWLYMLLIYKPVSKAATKE